ncbi:MAG: iron-containing redox enzyme family protein [Pseudomonadota bacterium]
MSNARVGACFIQNVCQDVLASAAVAHPYLTAMRNGDFPDVDFAFKDFAFQYGLYSSKFIRYVAAVIDNLQSESHRRILLSNLAEEQGDTHDVELPPDVLATVEGQPHTKLYRRFQEALGVDDDYRQSALQSESSLQWRDQFLDLCKLNEFVGVGAVGIGTEMIVSHVYKQILQGLKAHSQLTMIERVFFDLHSECDEHHAAQMITIAEELALDRAACRQIEYGAHRAVELRVEFWDEMLERAHSVPAQNRRVQLQ